MVDDETSTTTTTSSEPQATGTEERCALELRAETINLVAVKRAERRGVSDRLEIGKEAASDTATGHEEVNVEGNYRLEGKDIETSASILKRTFRGRLNLRLYSDTLMLSGAVSETFAGVVTSGAGMCDVLGAAGGLRVTTSGDFRLINGLAGMEEKPGTSINDKLLLEIAATSFQREYGVASYKAAFASYSGEKLLSMEAGTWSMLKASLGFRQQIKSQAKIKSGRTAMRPNPGMAPAAETGLSVASNGSLLLGTAVAGRRVADNATNTQNIFKQVNKTEEIEIAANQLGLAHHAGDATEADSFNIMKSLKDSAATSMKTPRASANQLTELQGLEDIHRFNTANFNNLADLGSNIHRDEISDLIKNTELLPGDIDQQKLLNKLKQQQEKYRSDFLSYIPKRKLKKSAHEKTMQGFLNKTTNLSRIIEVTDNGANPVRALENIRSGIKNDAAKTGLEELSSLLDEAMQTSRRSGPDELTNSSSYLNRLSDTGNISPQLIGQEATPHSILAFDPDGIRSKPYSDNIRILQDKYNQIEGTINEVSRKIRNKVLEYRQAQNAGAAGSDLTAINNEILHLREDIHQLNNGLGDIKNTITKEEAMHLAQGGYDEAIGKSTDTIDSRLYGDSPAPVEIETTPRVHPEEIVADENGVSRAQKATYAELEGAQPSQVSLLHNGQQNNSVFRKTISDNLNSHNRRSLHDTTPSSLKPELSANTSKASTPPTPALWETRSKWDWLSNLFRRRAPIVPPAAHNAIDEDVVNGLLLRPDQVVIDGSGSRALLPGGDNAADTPTNIAANLERRLSQSLEKPATEPVLTPTEARWHSSQAAPSSNYALLQPSASTTPTQYAPVQLPASTPTQYAPVQLPASTPTQYAPVQLPASTPTQYAPVQAYDSAIPGSATGFAGELINKGDTGYQAAKNADAASSNKNSATSFFAAQDDVNFKREFRERMNNYRATSKQQDGRYNLEVLQEYRKMQHFETEIGFQHIDANTKSTNFWERRRMIEQLETAIFKDKENYFKKYKKHPHPEYVGEEVQKLHNTHNKYFNNMEVRAIQYKSSKLKYRNEAFDLAEEALRRNEDPVIALTKKRDEYSKAFDAAPKAYPDVDDAAAIRKVVDAQSALIEYNNIILDFEAGRVNLNSTYLLDNKYQAFDFTPFNDDTKSLYYDHLVKHGSGNIDPNLDMYKAKSDYIQRIEGEAYAALKYTSDDIMKEFGKKKAAGMLDLDYEEYRKLFIMENELKADAYNEIADVLKRELNGEISTDDMYKELGDQYNYLKAENKFAPDGTISDKSRYYETPIARSERQGILEGMKSDGIPSDDINELQKRLAQYGRLAEDPYTAAFGHLFRRLLNPGAITGDTVKPYFKSDIVLDHPIVSHLDRAKLNDKMVALLKPMQDQYKQLLGNNPKEAEALGDYWELLNQARKQMLSGTDPLISIRNKIVALDAEKAADQFTKTATKTKETVIKEAVTKRALYYKVIEELKPIINDPELRLPLEQVLDNRAVGLYDIERAALVEALPATLYQEQLRLGALTEGGLNDILLDGGKAPAGKYSDYLGQFPDGRPLPDEPYGPFKHDNLLDAPLPDDITLRSAEPLPTGPLPGGWKRWFRFKKSRTKPSRAVSGIDGTTNEIHETYVSIDTVQKMKRPPPPKPPREYDSGQLSALRMDDAQTGADSINPTFGMRYEQGGLLRPIDDVVNNQKPFNLNIELAPRENPFERKRAYQGPLNRGESGGKGGGEGDPPPGVKAKNDNKPQQKEKTPEELAKLKQGNAEQQRMYGELADAGNVGDEVRHYVAPQDEAQHFLPDEVLDDGILPADQLHAAAPMAPHKPLAIEEDLLPAVMPPGNRLQQQAAPIAAFDEIQIAQPADNIVGAPVILEDLGLQGATALQKAAQQKKPPRLPNLWKRIKKLFSRKQANKAKGPKQLKKQAKKELKQARDAEIRQALQDKPQFYTQHFQNRIEDLTQQLDAADDARRADLETEIALYKGALERIDGGKSPSAAANQALHFLAKENGAAIPKGVATKYLDFVKGIDELQTQKIDAIKQNYKVQTANLDAVRRQDEPIYAGIGEEALDRARVEAAGRDRADNFDIYDDDIANRQVPRQHGDEDIIYEVMPQNNLPRNAEALDAAAQHRGHGARGLVEQQQRFGARGVDGQQAEGPLAHNAEAIQEAAADRSLNRVIELNGLEEQYRIGGEAFPEHLRSERTAHTRIVEAVPGSNPAAVVSSYLGELTGAPKAHVQKVFDELFGNNAARGRQGGLAPQDAGYRQAAAPQQPVPHQGDLPPAARPNELPPGGQRVADAGAEGPLAHNAEAAEEATPTDKLLKRLAELDVSEKQYKGKGEAFPAHLGYEKKAIESAFNAALDDGDPVAVIKRHLGIDGLSGDAKAHLQKTLDELFGNNAARGRQGGLAPQDAGYRQAAAPQQPVPHQGDLPPAARPNELPPGGQRVADAGAEGPLAHNAEAIQEAAADRSLNRVIELNGLEEQYRIKGEAFPEHLRSERTAHTRIVEAAPRSNPAAVVSSYLGELTGASKAHVQKVFDELFGNNAARGRQGGLAPQDAGYRQAAAPQQPAPHQGDLPPAARPTELPPGGQRVADAGAEGPLAHNAEAAEEATPTDKLLKRLAELDVSEKQYKGKGEAFPAHLGYEKKAIERAFNAALDDGDPVAVIKRHLGIDGLSGDAKAHLQKTLDELFGNNAARGRQGGLAPQDAGYRQAAAPQQPAPHQGDLPPAARPTELPPGGQRVADAGAEGPLAHNAEAAEEATPTDKLLKRLAELGVSEEQYKGKGEAFPAHLGYEKKAIESAFNAALDDGDPVAVIKRHLGIDGLSGDAKAHLQKTLDELFGNNAARGRQGGLAPQDAGYRQAAAPQQPAPHQGDLPPAARPTELPPGGQRVADAGAEGPLAHNAEVTQEAATDRSLKRIVELNGLAEQYRIKGEAFPEHLRSERTAHTRIVEAAPGSNPAAVVSSYLGELTGAPKAHVQKVFAELFGNNAARGRQGGLAPQDAGYRQAAAPQQPVPHQGDLPPAARPTELPPGGQRVADAGAEGPLAHNAEAIQEAAADRSWNRIVELNGLEEKYKAKGEAFPEKWRSERTAHTLLVDAAPGSNPVAVFRDYIKELSGAPKAYVQKVFDLYIDDSAARGLQGGLAPQDAGYRQAAAPQQPLRPFDNGAQQPIPHQGDLPPAARPTELPPGGQRVADAGAEGPLAHNAEATQEAAADRSLNRIVELNGLEEKYKARGEAFPEKWRSERTAHTLLVDAAPGSNPVAVFRDYIKELSGAPKAYVQKVFDLYIDDSAARGRQGGFAPQDAGYRQAAAPQQPGPNKVPPPPAARPTELPPGGQRVAGAGAIGETPADRLIKRLDGLSSVEEHAAKDNLPIPSQMYYEQEALKRAQAALAGGGDPLVAMRQYIEGLEGTGTRPVDKDYLWKAYRQIFGGEQPPPVKAPDVNNPLGEQGTFAKQTAPPPRGQRVADIEAGRRLAHTAEAAEEATPTDKLLKRLAELGVSEEQYKGKGEAFPAHLGYEKKAIESAFNAALDDGDPVAVIKRHLGIDGLSGDAKAHLQKTLDGLFGEGAGGGARHYVGEQPPPVKAPAAQVPAKPIAKAANALPVEANKVVLSEAKKTEAGADGHKGIEGVPKNIETPAQLEEFVRSTYGKKVGVTIEDETLQGYRLHKYEGIVYRGDGRTPIRLGSSEDAFFAPRQPVATLGEQLEQAGLGQAKGTSGRQGVSTAKHLEGAITYSTGGASFSDSSFIYVIDTTKIGNEKAYDLGKIVTDNFGKVDETGGEVNITKIPRDAVIGWIRINNPTSVLDDLEKGGELFSAKNKPSLEFIVRKSNPVEKGLGYNLSDWVQGQPTQGTSRTGVIIKGQPPQGTPGTGVIIKGQPPQGTPGTGVIIKGQPPQGTPGTGVIIKGQPPQGTPETRVIIKGDSAANLKPENNIAPLGADDVAYRDALRKVIVEIEEKLKVGKLGTTDHVFRIYAYDAIVAKGSAVEFLQDRLARFDYIEKFKPLKQEALALQARVDALAGGGAKAVLQKAPVPQVPAKPTAQAANAPPPANKVVMPETKKVETGTNANKGVATEVQQREASNQVLRNQLEEYRKNPPIDRKQPGRYDVSTEWFIKNSQEALAQDKIPPNEHLLKKFRYDKAMDNFGVYADHQLRNLIEKMETQVQQLLDDNANAAQKAPVPQPVPAKPIAKAANALPVEANKVGLSEAKKTEAGADANKAVDPEVQRLEELKKTLENKIAEYRKNPPLAGKEGPEQYKVSTEWFLENGQEALAQNNTPPDKYLSRQFRMDKDGFYSANTDNQLRNLFEKIGVKI